MAAPYRIDDLGTLEGLIPDDDASPAINNSGTIVGTLDVDPSHKGPPLTKTGFVWDFAHGMRPLPAPASGQPTEARAINDTGTVAGAAGGLVSLRGLVWLDVAKPPSILAGTKEFPQTFAHAINCFGVIGGGGNLIDASAGAPPPAGIPIVWWPPYQTPTVFPHTHPYPVSTEVRGINCAATPLIVGNIGDTQAFSTPAMNLDVYPLQTGLIALAVNDQKVIVGSFQKKPAIFTTTGQPTTLTLPPPFSEGEACAVNALGHVVGWMANPPLPGEPPFQFTAFYYGPTHTGIIATFPEPIRDWLQFLASIGLLDPQSFSGKEILGLPTLVPLSDLIDPGSGWQLRKATAINNAGWITGVGLHNGSHRPFVMRPKTPSSGLGRAVVAELTTIIAGGILGQSGWAIDAAGHVVRVPDNNPAFARSLVATQKLLTSLLLFHAAGSLHDVEHTARILRRETLAVMRDAIHALGSDAEETSSLNKRHPSASVDGPASRGPDSIGESK